MLETYIITLVGVVLTQIAPGPTFLAVISAGLSQGRRAALLRVVGVSAAMLVWASLVTLGLGSVLAVFPMLLATMKVAGGLYLLWMGLRAAKSAISGQEMSLSSRSKKMSAVSHLRSGFLVVLSNPKAGLMWVAVGTFLYGSGLTAWQVIGFGPFGALSGLIIYGAYALLFSTEIAARGYARFSKKIELIFGAVFGLLGSKLLFDGMREIKT